MLIGVRTSLLAGVLVVEPAEELRWALRWRSIKDGGLGGVERTERAGARGRRPESSRRIGVSGAGAATGAVGVTGTDGMLVVVRGEFEESCCGVCGCFLPDSSPNVGSRVGAKARVSESKPFF